MTGEIALQQTVGTESVSILQSLAVTSPFLVLGGGALLLLLLSVFIRERLSSSAFCAVILVCSLYALWRVVGVGDAALPVSAFAGMVAIDRLSAVLAGVILCGALMSVCLSAGSLRRNGVDSPAEYYVLLLIATAGAMLFCASTEMVTLFLALETMSMALYCLCGSAISRRESAESALKYFLLGSMSSAVMLYGIALLYGLTGSLSFEGIASGLAAADDRFLVNVAMALTLVGFVFKIGSVPFHFWAPDVYQGAPTFVTAFMATTIKAASVAAFLRVLWTVFGSQFVFWSSFISVTALLSMVVGNFLALRQRSVKRMLAYSSVANGGYLMLGLLAPGEVAGGQQAIVYYLVAYLLLTMGALGVVLIVSESNKEGSDDIRQFEGLRRRSPILAGLMALFMLGLAGLPPGMAGLIGKIYLFSSAVRAEFMGLAILGILASVIGCYYYLNVIVAMYFRKSGEQAGSNHGNHHHLHNQDDSQHGDSQAEESAFTPINISSGRAAVLWTCAVLVIVLGTFPSVIYDLTLPRPPVIVKVAMADGVLE